MVEVTTARGTYRYVYDALGEADGKTAHQPLTVNRTTGRHFYGTECGWRRRAGRREQTALYIYRDPGSYEPLARVDKAGKEGPNRILYFHTDVNGAPEEMTDSDGKIVWETGVSGLGVTRYRRRTTAGWRRTCATRGQYLDRETGLHYNLHRYYDPDVGRFMVTDPIGLAGGE